MVVSGKIEEGILAVSGDFTNIDWLPKPIDETQLLKKMQKLLTISTGQALRVLHVENDTDLQQVVHSVIAGQFEVEAVTTLTDARARLSREHFDIVLLNLGLPDGSGWDLLPEIRSRLPKAKVIILSGMDVSLDAAREVEAVLLKSKMSPQKLLDAMTAQVGLTNSEGTT
jgi:DNA-binding NtrC family response regulator